MPVYRDKERGTWYVSTSYKNMEGERKRKAKRGFGTKRDALKWEFDFQNRMSRSMDKTFGEFWINYIEDKKPRLRETTWQTKEYMINNKILFFFRDLKMNEIKARDVLKWQNEIIQMRMPGGGEYSHEYFKSIQAQLSAVFNHAVKYYDLEYNPVKNAEPIMGGRPQQFQYWTKEEFQTCILELKEKDHLYYTFQLLYWSGIRIGELFALTKEDFDFEQHILSISKTFSIVKKKEIITRPKTLRSIRKVWLPESLSIELKVFIEHLNLDKEERIFLFSKTYLNNQFKKYAVQADINKIRIHDLRHSHISLLIHMGFSAVAIGKRVGHKSERITYYYAHLFPGVEEEMATRLNVEMQS